MRVSDLLGVEVLDRDGKTVGKAHDVRLVRDGPVQGMFGPAYRVQGLIVGVGSFGARLGYDRSRMKGPLPLKALFVRMGRSARFVDWALVDTVQPGSIHISAAAGDLPAVPRLPR